MDHEYWLAVLIAFAITACAAAILYGAIMR